MAQANPAKRNLSNECSDTKPKVQAIFYNNPDNYPPIVNGSRLLVRAGFDVEILCRDNGKRWSVAYPDGASVVRIDTHSGSSWREYFGFIRRVFRLGQAQTSVFVSHDAHALLPAWLLAKRYGRPLVYHCHDYTDKSFPLPTLGGRLVVYLQRALAKRADLITIPDKNLGAIMREELRLGSSPLVVANGPIAALACSGDALRNALKSDGKVFEKIVLRQGRIGTGHAIENTLRSMPLWANSKWGFVVMGLSDPKYLAKLDNLAKSIGVADRFVILPPVGYDDVQHFTAGADLGHALYEPSQINNIHITGSNKIQEYMAAGLPIMVSDRPSLRTLVERHRCGLTADESSPQKIAETINAILGDTERAGSMGRAGALAFQKELSFERQFAPVIDSIRSLADANGATPVAHSDATNSSARARKQVRDNSIPTFSDRGGES